MDVLTFGTTNEGKLKEVSEILGIKVDGIGLEVDEIQSLDRTQVALKKARAYFQQVNKPLLVEDNSLEFVGLKGLPGTFIDYFFKMINPGRMIKHCQKKPPHSKGFYHFFLGQHLDCLVVQVIMRG